MSGGAWRDRPISELCSEIIDCVNKTAPVVKGPTPYRMIRTTNVKRGLLDLTSVRYVEKETYDKWTRRGAPRTGDIVLTREAPLGEVALVHDDAGIFLGQRLMMYRVDQGQADRSFLMNAMRAPDVQAQIKAFGSGSTVEHMRVPDCGRLVVACPDVVHQRRIGAVFRCFDELVAVNERRIELLKDLARSLYREWFGRLRFPGHEAARAQAGRLPSGWREARLGDTTDIVMGQSPRSEFYNIDGDGLPFHQGVSDYGALIPVHRKFSTIGSRVAREGDLLLSVRAPVGRLNVADRELILGRGIAALRRKDGAVAFQFEHVRRIMGKENSIGGGTIYHAVNKAELASLQSVEPAQDVIDAFERVARPLLESRITLTAANRCLAATRDLLLTRLVTGRLDISDVDLGDLLSAEAA